MYELHFTGSFRQDVKRILKRNYETKSLSEILYLLEKNGIVPIKNNPHKLSGKYADCWECHIKPDWLLVWRKNELQKIIELVRTGSHADLFK